MKNLTILLIISLLSCQRDSIETVDQVTGTWYITDVDSHGENKGVHEILVLASGDYESVVINDSAILTYDNHGNITEKSLYKLKDQQITISSSDRDQVFDIRLDQDEMILSNEETKFVLNRSK